MQGRGIRLDAIQGNEGWYVPLPATFVVGQNGRIIARSEERRVGKECA